MYPHTVLERRHPLVAGVNTRFDVPHSRFNEVFPDQFATAHLNVLVASEDGDVHLATSEDGFRLVFFQGHPEYDAISLLKEYKREVGRYINGEIEHYPPFPEYYLSMKSQAILEEYQEHLSQALGANETPPDFPEEYIIPLLHNTWHDTAEAVINNWIGKVYQITHTDRHIPFNEGTDPADPLGLKATQ